VSQVNLNGAISFESDLPDYRSNLVLPFGVKVIAPFFADVDTRLSGNVYYR
jgi:nidogen (entactin)